VAVLPRRVSQAWVATEESPLDIPHRSVTVTASAIIDFAFEWDLPRSLQPPSPLTAVVSLQPQLHDGIARPEDQMFRFQRDRLWR
jgi:hypothetical protein